MVFSFYVVELIVLWYSFSETLRVTDNDSMNSSRFPPGQNAK